MKKEANIETKMKNKFFMVEGDSECEVAKEILDNVGEDYELVTLSRYEAEYSRRFFPQLLTEDNSYFGVFEINSYANGIQLAF